MAAEENHESLGVAGDIGTLHNHISSFQMGTMASLNASTTHSIAGSRPTTPHSTVSTAPVM